MVRVHPDPLRSGAIAQLGERLLCTQEVNGSIPFGSNVKFGKSFEEFFANFSKEKYVLEQDKSTTLQIHSILRNKVRTVDA